MKSFWYMTEGGHAGPVDAAGLKALFGAGRIDAATQIWREGYTEWRTLGEVFPVVAERSGRAEQPAFPLAGAAFDALARVGAGVTSNVDVGKPPAFEAPASIGQLLGEYLSPNNFGALFRSPKFWMLYSLAAVPLAIAFFGSRDPAQFFFFYFSLVWAFLFHKLSQPEAGSVRHASFVYVGSAFVAVPLLLAWLSVPLDVINPLLASRSGLMRLAGFVLGVGAREELAKMLPFAALMGLLSRRKVRLSLRQGLFLGTVAGLAFAATENVQYLQRFEAIDRIAQSYGQFSRLGLEVTLMRLTLTPFMHGAWSGIVGFFFVWGSWNPSRRWTLRLGGLASAAILHGVYNTLAGEPAAALLVIAFTFLVFARCLARATDATSEVGTLEAGF